MYNLTQKNIYVPNFRDIPKDLEGLKISFEKLYSLLDEMVHTINSNATNLSSIITHLPTIKELVAADMIPTGADTLEIAGKYAAVTLTSTPTIPDGYGGQRILLIGTSNTNTVKLQDEASLTGSNLAMGFDVTLGAGETLELVYSPTLGKWAPITQGETLIHNELYGLQGGTTNEYYHLTQTEHSYVSGVNAQSVLTTASPSFVGLTLSGNSATLTHSGTTSLTIASTSGTVIVDGVTHNAGALSGITTLSMSGQLTNTLAIGTSPFAITSTTVNTNLNADLWDGYQFADYLDQAVKIASSPTFAGLTLTGKFIVPITSTSAATYVVLSTDYYISSTRSATGSQAVTLPAIGTSNHGQVYHLKDAGYGAAANNITVSPTGADTVDNGASFVFSANGECITFIANNTTKNWEVQ